MASASAELPDKEWYQPAVLIQESHARDSSQLRLGRLGPHVDRGPDSAS